jgi:hypothetical protein
MTANHNPNNCKTCDHGQPPGKPQDGHCYMFKNAPTEVCMQHTSRKEFGTIAHISQYGSATLQALILNNLVKHKK